MTASAGEQSLKCFAYENIVGNCFAAMRLAMTESG